MEKIITKNWILLSRLKKLHGMTIKIRIERSHRYDGSSVTTFLAKDFIYNRTDGKIRHGVIHTKHAEVQNYMSIRDSRIQDIFLLQNKLCGSSPGDLDKYSYLYGWSISIKNKDGLFYIDYQSESWMFAIYLIIDKKAILLEDWLNKDITLYDLI